MKIKELDLFLQDIEETSIRLKELSGELRAMFTTTEEHEPKEKEVSFTDPHALCANQSRVRFTAAIKDKILNIGAKKRSEVESNRYGKLYRRVEALK